jgi:DegV family protein with EDD domain
VSAGAKTTIVCDTTAYLPAELLREHGISEVSLYVSLDGEQRPESEITDYPGFYQRLLASEDGATTSQPSIGDFLEVYEPLLDEGRSVISIHLSAGISGTVDSASQARRRLVEEGRGGERVHVVDSRTACAGMGMLVLTAVRAIEAGAEPEQVVERVLAAREELRLWFAVDTLEYLRKGGRIGAASAWLGSALKVKPILALEVEITPVERVRTSRRAFERMVEFARELHRDGADAWLVMYIQERDAADRLIAEGREILGCDPILITEVGPVIGAHIGPGLLGIGGAPRRLLG